VQRILGATAIFAGWLSITVGAMAGLIWSDFFGLNHKEGDLPPMSVYGLTGAVVLWVFVAAAVLLAVPLAAAMFAPDPRLRLRLLAVLQALAGVALIPDVLGRAFGLPIVAGAVCLWVGGEMIHREAVAGGLTKSESPTPALAFAADAAGADAAGADAAGADAAGSSDATAPAGPGPAAAQAHPRRTSADSPVPGLAAAPPPPPARAARHPAKTPTHICPWCSAAVRAHTESCPNCHATLNARAADSIHIPGLTEVPPELLKYAEDSHAGKKRAGLRSAIFGGSDIPVVSNPEPPSDDAALQPPSPALIAEMARLDAEIAAEAASLHGPAGGGIDGAAATPAAPARPSRPRRGATRT
jgi:hypothetical protein